MTLYGGGGTSGAGEAAAVEPPRVRAHVRETLRDATLGEYEILHELGRGGMATVFLGHDIALDRRVAIKVIAPHLLEGKGMAERFKLEARTAAQLSHPNIIPIYAVRETEETLFFVMKHVEGRGLDEIISARGALPVAMVREVLGKVGEALDYAHSRSVVHRDVKPANILIDESGMPIVTDFGIAKVSDATGLTMTGATLGTPSYMSPEQCEAGAVTGASDQYSLGVVAYQMLGGRLPFEGTNPFAVMYKHCNEPPPPLRELRGDLPEDLVSAVDRMLAKRPEDRWPSLADAVQQIVSAGRRPEASAVRTQLMALARDPDTAVLGGLGASVVFAPPSTAPVEGGAPSGEVPTEAPGTASSAETRAVRGEGESSVASPSPVTAAVEVSSRTSGATRRWGLVGALVGIAVITVGALAVVRPWSGAVEGSGSAGAMGSDGAATASRPEPSPGSAPGVDADDPPLEAVAEGPDETPEAGDQVPPPASETTPAGTSAGESTTGSGDPPPPAVATVRIQGLPQRMEVGAEATATAVALDGAGGAVGGGESAWSSDDPDVVRVSATGRVTAVAPGRATVSSRVEGVTGRWPLEVAPASVAQVTVTPQQLSLSTGERSALRVELRDARGTPLTDRPVAWTSDAPEIARVSATGEVEAMQVGTAVLTAAAGGVEMTVQVAVTAAVPSVREAIDAGIAAYGRALESGDIAAVRGAYPGITARQARELEGALAGMENLEADLIVEDIREQGDLVVAEVTGTYRFVNATNGRREEARVQFTAIFERVAGGWRLIETR